MDDLVGDFLCFSSLPTDGAGRVRQDVRLEDGRIFVRGGATGTARVRYRRLPAAIDGNDPGQKIDLPRECLPLVPLLAASYIWLDDDPDKAADYLNAYREALLAVRRNETSLVDAAYENVTGW